MAHATAGRPPAVRTRAASGGLSKQFIAAGILLGIGLGGFVDGIVLHQLLQWHHMLTATGHHPADTVPGLEDNTLWDGIFHSATWVATALGLYNLWDSAPFHRRGWGWALVGFMAMGWGLFNLVEGLVDHHILTIHHVRDDVSNKLPWDLGFLASGVVLVVVGYLVSRRAAAAAVHDGQRS